MRLNSPIEIYWCVTNRCNLSCVFCLTDSAASSPDELDVHQRDFILQEIIGQRVLKVYLTGGEPLMVAEIFDYIEQLRHANIFVELTTNGTLLNAQNIRRLKRLDVNRIQLSLNGATEFLNDQLMGHSFRAIVENLHLLLAASISTHVKVTATRVNIHDIPQLVRLLMQIGVSEIDISEVHPLGRAFEKWRVLAPAITDLEKLESNLKLLPEYQQHQITFHSPTLQLLEQEFPSVCTVGSDAGYSCLISAQGQVLPCAFASVWRMENNILTSGLNASWHGLNKFKQFVNPVRLIGKCADCDIREDCKGGCRALALMFSGDVRGEYPFCNYRGHKEAYEDMEKTNHFITPVSTG